MKNISTSKVVFFMMALTACVGFFLGNLTEANYMLLAGGAFTYYFTKIGTGNAIVSVQ
jgi:hypothetical protein